MLRMYKESQARKAITKDVFIPKFFQDLKTTWRSGTSSTLVGDKVIDVEIGRIGPGIILLSEEPVLDCFQGPREWQFKGMGNNSARPNDPNAGYMYVCSL
jgi:hypothetical protein